MSDADSRELPSSLTATAPAAAPLQGEIELAELVSKSVAAVQYKLNRCLEYLSRDPAEARRNPEIRFDIVSQCVCEMKAMLLKIFAIVNWYKSNADFLRNRDLLNRYIASDAEILDKSEYFLAQIGSGMFSKRTRVFEVKTAMDVLSSRGYFSLPEFISNGGRSANLSVIPRDTLLRDLNIYISSKLRLNDKMPNRLSKHSKVVNGVLLLHIPHMYELSLSLSHLSEAAPWIVNGFKVLVHSHEDEDLLRTYNYAEFDLNMFEILHQKCLLPSNLKACEDPAPISAVPGAAVGSAVQPQSSGIISSANDNSNSTSNGNGNGKDSDLNKPQALDHMTLHKFQIICEHSCYSAAIRLLFMQAKWTSQGIWRGYIGVEQMYDPKANFAFVVRFWKGLVSKEFQYELRIIEQSKPDFKKLKAPNGQQIDVDEYTLGDALFNCELWIIDPNRKADGSYSYTPCISSFQDYIPLHDCILNGVSFTKIWSSVITFMGRIVLNVFQERVSYSIKKDSWEIKGLEHVIDENDCKYTLMWRGICDHGLSVNVNQFDGTLVVHSLIMNDVKISVGKRVDIFVDEINSLQSEIALAKALQNDDYISFCCQKASGGDSMTPLSASAGARDAAMETMSSRNSGSVLASLLDDDRGTTKFINSISPIILDVFISSIAQNMKLLSTLSNKQSLSYDILEGFAQSKLPDLVSLNISDLSKYRCLVYNTNSWSSAESMRQPLPSGFSGSSSNANSKLGIWHHSPGLYSHVGTGLADVLPVERPHFHDQSFLARRSASTGEEGSEKPGLLPDTMLYFVILLDIDMNVTFISVKCEIGANSCFSTPSIREAKKLNSICTTDFKDRDLKTRSINIKTSLLEASKKSITEHLAFASSQYGALKSNLLSHISSNKGELHTKRPFLHVKPLGSFTLMRPQIIDNKTLLFRIHRLPSSDRSSSGDDLATNYFGSLHFEIIQVHESVWLDFSNNNFGASDELLIDFNDERLTLLERHARKLVSLNFNFVTSSLSERDTNELEVSISTSNANLFFYKANSNESLNDFTGYENYAYDIQRLYENSLIQKLNSLASVEEMASPSSRSNNGPSSFDSQPLQASKIQLDSFWNGFSKSISVVTPLAMMIYHSSNSPAIRLEYIYENSLQPKALFACQSYDSQTPSKIGVSGYLEAVVNFKLAPKSFDFAATNVILVKDMVKAFSESFNISDFESSISFKEKMARAVEAYVSMPNKMSS